MEAAAPSKQELLLGSSCCFQRLPHPSQLIPLCWTEPACYPGDTESTPPELRKSCCEFCRLPKAPGDSTAAKEQRGAVKSQLCSFHRLYPCASCLWRETADPGGTLDMEDLLQDLPRPSRAWGKDKSSSLFLISS